MGIELLFSIRGLTKTFPGPIGGPDFVALDGIDLDIIEGETTLIAGANGSGKTVLMHILAGLLERTKGEIFYKGKPAATAKDLLKGSVGLMFQDADAQILGETVEEDIRFGPENLKLPKEEIDKGLEQTLTDLGLAEKRHFTARKLSGGEKRRLVAAGVLAMGCQAIIMDEPFANLDWPGVVQVLNIIRDLKGKGKTIIILTHELEKVLALSDRLTILAEGKIRDWGGPEVVLDRLDPGWGVRDPRRTYRTAGDCTWL